MNKENFGHLIARMSDDLPLPYIDDEDELEGGKTITPPPGFDELNENGKGDPASFSRANTLKSSFKLKNPLSKKI